MPVIPTFSGGISLLSSSLMPYRTLLTSCDDMNVYLVPLYRPHGGKTQSGLSDILCFSKTCQTIDSEEKFVLWSESDCIYPVKTNVNIAVNQSEFVTAGSRAKRAKTCSQCRKTCPSAGRHVIKKVCNQCQTREGVSTRLPLVLVSFLICPRKRWYSQIVHNAIS